MECSSGQAEQKYDDLEEPMHLSYYKRGRLLSRSSSSASAFRLSVLPSEARVSVAETSLLAQIGASLELTTGVALGGATSVVGGRWAASVVALGRAASLKEFSLETDSIVLAELGAASALGSASG